MKRLILMVSLFVTIATFAGQVTINNSKSNNLRLTYHADIMTADQAKTLLAEIEKFGRPDPETMRKWLPANFKRLGIDGSRVNKIDAFFVKGRKQMSILLLSDPNDEEEARASNLDFSKSN